MQVNEIFQSIDGEVNHWGQGCISTFIRLGGCNLRCSYCDTPDTQTTDSSTEMSVEDIVEKVPTGSKVTITGGEPLLQRDNGLIALMTLLARDNHSVISIESNGTQPIITDFGSELLNQNMREAISWVLDYKLDNEKKTDHLNFNKLSYEDWVKFPITSKEDYCKALMILNPMKRNEVFWRFKVAFSPIDFITPKQLMDWLIKDKEYNIRINLQIHKLAGLK